ncbi:FGGY family pentulose kinase [Martelella endophytica]|uniref:Ribulokinase n=1 Tax=Martelella endophytica TaxID=1486262 RepID=A0A0D5LMS2_MAREN|nr:FGGY family pentulose kinase [Martelella endophytica]AJY45260.1 ribulokinase [Martelella endophytica]
MRDHLIAVDVGTASVRAGLFDRAGVMLARQTHPLMLRRPAARRGEYASEDIWQATCAAVKATVEASGIGADRVAGIAFGATCSLVLLDRERRPLPLAADDGHVFDTIAWFDHRAAQEAAELTATGDPAVRHSGGSVSPEMQFPKLLWLKRNRPELWQQAGLVFDLADFLTFRATGNAARSLSTLTAKWFYRPDRSDPEPSDLMRQVGLCDLAGKAGFSGSVLSPGETAGTLNAEAAAALGLDTTVTVAAGLIDAYAGALGALPSPEAKGPGDLALIGGTSSCLVGYAHEPAFARSLWGPYFSALYSGQWLFEAGQSATGGLLNHLIEVSSAGGIATEARHAEVIARIGEMIAENGVGFADGLDILPDFHGSRSPFADPSLTGMIAGLTLDNSFDGLCRLYWRASVAIALSLRQILTLMEENGLTVATLHLAGGHRRNPLLTKLYADATGRSVAIMPAEDAVLLGSAINAASAAGLFDGLGAAAGAMQGAPRVIAPDADLAGYYDRQLSRLEILQQCRATLQNLGVADMN